jgi:hypothetical protein
VNRSDPQRETLERVADHDPELAARLILMTLPAATAAIPAYRALKRRMKVLGLEAPPPEDLMPGPID